MNGRIPVVSCLLRIFGPHPHLLKHAYTTTQLAEPHARLFPQSILWRSLLLMAPLFFALASCDKGPLHEDLVIHGNTPPPFEGVSTVQLQTYINKLHIDLLGRGPTVSELEAMTEAFKSDDFREEDLDDVLSDMQQTYEWAKSYDAHTKGRFLNGTDSFAINESILIYESSVQYYYDIGDTVLAVLVGKLLEDLIELQDAARNLWTGFVDFNEYHRRHLINPFYDEINMGSENYVLACFENLYFREPTESELDQGVLMVDGISSFLFLQDGDSKRDFAEIAVRADPYYEGLVIEAYTLLLARKPDSWEMASQVEDLKETGDYRALQRHIVKGSEYAGF
jgi:hypothetical protein